MNLNNNKAIEQLTSFKRYCLTFPGDELVWQRDIHALDIAIETLKNKDGIDKLSQEEKSWHEGFIELDNKVKNAAKEIYILKDLILAYGKDIKHKQITDTLSAIEGGLKNE